MEYIGTQLIKEQLEIFMGLKDGSVEDLMLQGLFTQESSYQPANLLLHHVLMGIDYLRNVNVIHRDLKPANILFTRKSASDFHFQIADFGLCNFTDNARTYTGSPIFMAPEILRNDGVRQTVKVDVWSLFVTMAYVMDVDGYRKKCFGTNQHIIKSALEAAETTLLSPLKEMAILDPNERASAADMLRKLFKGEGLTTPLDQLRDRRPCCDSKSGSGHARIPAEKVVSPALNQAIPLPMAKARARFPGITKGNVEKHPRQTARPEKLNERRRLLKIPGMFPGDT